MALLANQIMDARIFSSMNGRVELSQFLRVTNQSIVSQVSSAHDDNRKNRKYPCPLCGKRFRFNSILSLHMRTHTGEKPFKCPYCDHRAAQKGNLKIHLRTHKQGILGKGRGRIREENRLLHELEERAILRDRQMRAGLVGPQPSIVTQLQQPRLPQIHAKFVNRSVAAQHHPQASISPKVTAIHDEPVQSQASGFRCSFCKGKFRKQQELERHIRILHKPYKCTLCEFAASQEEELIGHVETTHITTDSGAGHKLSVGAGDKGKTVGEFPCEICGQTFSQAWFLKGHMRKHKDSFEHCCQICGRRFKEPWFLKNHMKVHLNKLASKSNLPAEHDSSLTTTNLTQDNQSSLYSQYISRIHNRFFSSERVDRNDYNQILTTAGAEMKVSEILGRMISSGPSPLTDAKSTSVLGFNHLHPPLSSTNLEYLQKVISSQDTLNSSSGSGSSYPGWQIMTPGLPVEQSSPYLPERCIPADEGNPCLADRDSNTISRPSSRGSLGHLGTGDTAAETGNPLSGSAADLQPQSSSPAPGEKVYRCPLSSDFALHLDRYHFAHWKNNVDLQPSSSGSSPNARLRPRSGGDWSPVTGQYLALDGQSDKDSGVEGSAPGRAKKSQHEPLDLSVRPESHLTVTPALLLQMSGVFSNELSPSIPHPLQGYSLAAARVGAQPPYQSDLSGTKDEVKAASTGSAGHNGDGGFENSERAREDTNNNAAVWKILRKNVLQTEEVGQAHSEFRDAGEKMGQWGRATAESILATPRSSTPERTGDLQHPGGLLSFLRSQRSASENAERDVASARKPFQCRYCPYSASQKGNLKTHVLCVHRKPFDNSLYPDRRLRRSHAPQRPAKLLPGVTGVSAAQGRDHISMTSLCGT